MIESVAVHKLGKRFRLYHKGRPTTLQESLIRRLKGTKPKAIKWALKDVTFSVSQGQMVGILGHNGAGKSTLLRLLGGVLQPDTGTVKVNGRIGGLLELGAGFHPDLTGSENIFINGVISGLNRKQVSQRFDQILAFSELEADIDHPLRTYSSGMKMRLGFAIAIFTEPDILLIDEVLAVGDLAFRKKCFDQIEQIRAQGKTIILVTHDTGQVSELCDQALWLDKGEVRMYGAPEEVVSSYRSAMLPQQNQQNIEPMCKKTLSAIRFSQIRLLDEDERPTKSLTSGRPAKIEFCYTVEQPVKKAVVSFSIFNSLDQLCCRLNSMALRDEWPAFENNGRIVVHLEGLNLVPGTYTIDAGIFNEDLSQSFTWQKKAINFQIKSHLPIKQGILLLNHRWAHQVESKPKESL